MQRSISAIPSTGAPFTTLDPARRTIWSWLGVAAILILAVGLVAVYARQQMGTDSTPPSNDGQPNIAAPSNVVVSPTPTLVVPTLAPKQPTISSERVETGVVITELTVSPAQESVSLITATPNPGTDSEQLRPTIQPPSDSLGCDSLSAISRLDDSATGQPEVAFLRISLEPGKSIALPGLVGPICVEQGTPEFGYGGLGANWQPYDSLMAEHAWQPLSIKASAAEPTSVLVGVTGSEARRISVPDGVRIEDLGGGMLYVSPTPRALLRIEAHQLAPGEQVDVDTGRGGAVVVAVERGEIELDPISGGTSALTRHDGSPITLSESIALNDDDAMNTRIPAGYSMLAQEASLTLMGGESGADVLLLVVDVNSAQLQTDGEPVAPAAEATRAVGEPADSLPECTTPELTREAYDAFFASIEDQAVVNQIITRHRFAVGEGVPSDEDVATAVEARVAQFFACAAAGEAYRYLGSFTMPFLSVFLLADESNYDDLADNLDSEGAPSDVSIIVWDVRTQVDDRVTAKVEIQGDAMLMTFALVDGLWLIDDLNDQAIIEQAPTATP
jgi:hypothetical protein